MAASPSPENVDRVLMSGPQIVEFAEAVIGAALLWFTSLANDGWTEEDIRLSSRPGVSELYDAVAAFREARAALTDNQEVRADGRV